jgi:hypothetical protein
MFFKQVENVTYFDSETVKVMDCNTEFYLILMFFKRVENVIYLS